MTLLLSPETPDWADLPTPRRFELIRTVQQDELDDLNHVNNTVYLAWCENVAREHAQSLGMGTAALAELGAVPVAQQHTIRYAKPALLGDLVRVRTLLIASEGLRSTRAYAIDRVNPSDPEGGIRPTARRTEWVWVDPVSGRPKRTPEEVRRRFGF